VSWLRLYLHCSASSVAAAADLLERFGAESISISPVSGEPIFAGADDCGEFWRSSRLDALFAPDAELDIIIACLRNRIGTQNLSAHGVELLGDCDWDANARSNAGPSLYGDHRLCICPSWAQPLRADHVLVLDPGLAFGTGGHATTRLCLEWLVRTDPSGSTVIDYGCGSGVLGLAAARLGARAVYAVDIDPQAVSATRANAERNGLQDRVQASLAEAAALPEADILIANILLKTLLGLAGSLSRLLRPGGRIAVSGVLAVQVELCLGAYRPWFKMAAPQFNGEWALLHGVRSGLCPIRRGT